MTEKIFFEDPRGFITSNNFMNVIPLPGMTGAESSNACMRAVIYGCVLDFAIGGNRAMDLAVLFIAILASAAAYLYTKYEVEAMSDKGDVIIDGKVCRGPTAANPLMNRTIGEPVDRPDGCDPSRPEVAARIAELLLPGQNPNLFNNRCFLRTMQPNPNKSLIPDTAAFTKFLVTGDSSGGDIPEKYFHRKVRLDARGAEAQDETVGVWSLDNDITKANMSGL